MIVGILKLLTMAVLAIVAALAGIAFLTVPMNSSAGPAVIMVASITAIVFLYRSLP